MIFFLSNLNGLEPETPPKNFEVIMGDTNINNEIFNSCALLLSMKIKEKVIQHKQFNTKHYSDSLQHPLLCRPSSVGRALGC